jgi:hypothetical protein
MIGNDGIPVSDNKNYKIDISGLHIQPTHSATAPINSTIRITDPNGYIYEFGGNVSALEYSVRFPVGSEWDHSFFDYDKAPRPTILAWHLSKITAPNGRTVTFNYVTQSNLGAYNVARNSPLFQSGKLTEYYPTVPNDNRIGSAVKKAVLESINTGATKIEFNKSLETTLQSFFPTHTEFNGPIYQLNSIVVKYNNTALYTYSLEYENKSKRRFLQKVTMPYGKYYKFDYNHPGSYPEPSNATNTGVDEYGFWSNNNTESSCGIMSRATYPTGGYSTFEYEKHEFSKAAELNVQTLKKNLVSSQNKTVKEVCNYEFEPITCRITGKIILPNYCIFVTIYEHNGARIKHTHVYYE